MSFTGMPSVMHTTMDTLASAASTNRRLPPKTSTSQLASKPAWNRSNAFPPNTADVPFLLACSRVYDPDDPICGQRSAAAIRRCVRAWRTRASACLRVRFCATVRSMSDVRSRSSKVVHHAVGVPPATASLRPVGRAVGASSPNEDGVATSGRR